MLTPLHNLDITVHAAALLATPDALRLGCDGPAFLLSTAHEVMLHDTRLMSGERASLRRLGGGYEMPAAVLLRPGTDTLLVADLHPAQREFTLYAAPMAGADQRHAEPLLRTSGQPLQLALHGSTLFYADHHRGALMALDLSPAALGKFRGQPLVPQELLSGLESPVGVAVLAGGQQVLVSERRPGRITSVQPDLMSTRGLLQVWQVERNELHSPQLLTVDEERGQLLLPQFATFGYVQQLDLDGGKLQTILRLATHQRPLAAWRIRSWLAVADTNGLRCWNHSQALAAMRPEASKLASGSL
jgi:hypothetical protein